MPQQFDVLQLGGFQFSGFSIPDLMPLGGRQNMTIHKLPGGSRVIDTLGPDEHDISWRGQFFQDNAINICVQLDAMRRQGSLIPLIVAGQSTQVVISEFTYSIRRMPMWIEYSITCVVNQKPPSTQSSGSNATDNAVSSDAANGADTSAGSVGQGVWGSGAPPVDFFDGGSVPQGMVPTTPPVGEVEIGPITIQPGH